MKREWRVRSLRAIGRFPGSAGRGVAVPSVEQCSKRQGEARDTCRFYLSTVDLTKDGHAIPLVDDLAAIPLSLWAHEHGYLRLQPNLLGT